MRDARRAKGLSECVRLACAPRVCVYFARLQSDPSHNTGRLSAARYPELVSVQIERVLKPQVSTLVGASGREICVITAANEPGIRQVRGIPRDNETKPTISRRRELISGLAKYQRSCTRVI
ncbi:hypothetical protein PUN28_014440 [Cardiocondyla obscurior]|uniref:Uncharacterized protein n=1 Tax=Cardiocondyla obscurior TaxID=286306 RepID=A0AAW2F581_9HYME